MPLLATIAAACEAAKLHKFIRQIVFQISWIRICFNQAVGTFAVESDQRFHAKTQTNIAPGYKHPVVS